MDEPLWKRSSGQASPAISAFARNAPDRHGAAMTTSPALPRLRLRLTPAAELAVRGGHPWVYAERVKEANRPGVTGETAVIYDRRDRFLGIGLFDAGSPLRVRMLHTGAPVTVNQAWWRSRLNTALDKRRRLFGAETDGYRWISGENDGWPGLVLDRYAGTVVLKLYSAVWLPRLAEVETMLRAALAPEALVLRLSRNIQDIARKEFGVTEGFRGEPGEETVIFTENGLRFEAEVRHGQKTGFFLDQRDNRKRAGELARGRDVVNAFSFSGGFSVYAARGGAKSVTDVDISAHALASAKRNFALNPSLSGVPHTGEQSDAFAWLANSAPRKAGLVITDPPSLAKRETERAGAITAYEKLAASALRHVAPGGVLLAASCSAHVSETEFFGAVLKAARKSGGRVETLWTAGHAADHPVTFPEAAYLKALALRVGG